jgi:hypothetical protein
MAEEKEPQLRVYASSAGWLWGDLPLTQYDSGCPRSIVWRQHNADLRTQIDPRYAEIGARHEAWFEEAHADKIEAREVPIKEELVKGVLYSGRADVLMKDGSIVETKGSDNLKTIPTIIKQGKWKASWLGQLASYFWLFGRDRGQIVYGVYGPEGQLANRTFNVRVEDDGRLTVDGKGTAFSVQDNITFYTRVAEAVADKVVWPERPLGWANKWGSPCSYCQFKPLCDKYDQGLVGEEESFQVARDYLGGKHE